MTAIKPEKRPKNKQIKESPQHEQGEAALLRPAVRVVHPSEDKPHLVESVAQRLKSARLSRKLTVENISSELRIRRDYIKAIEEEQLDRLPERAYTLGFVRSYGNFLGFDGLMLVKEYRQEHELVTDAPMVDRLSDVTEAATPSPKILWLSVAGAALVLLMGWVFLSMKQEPVDAEPVAVQALQQPSALPPAQEQNRPEAAAPEPANTPASLPALETALHATHQVWVRVYERGGKTLHDRILNAGEKIEIPLDGSAFLSTGNVAALVLEVNGEKRPFMGKPGEVKRHIPLEESAIKGYVSSSGPESH